MKAMLDAVFAVDIALEEVSLRALDKPSHFLDVVFIVILSDEGRAELMRKLAVDEKGNRFLDQREIKLFQTNRHRIFGFAILDVHRHIIDEMIIDGLLNDMRIDAIGVEFDEIP